MTFGERLKALRRASKKTGKQLAERIDVGEKAYQAYEQDRCTPPLPVLFRLSDLYDLTIDELCRGEKIKPAEGRDVLWRRYQVAAPSMKEAVDKLLGTN